MNRAGRKPKHLYILPGGVAEVFTSTPGRDIIVFGQRRGLCRLALETGEGRGWRGGCLFVCVR